MPVVNSDRIAALLTARFHQRQVAVVRDSIALGREIRRLVASLARQATEAASSVRGFNLRDLNNRLDVVVSRVLVNMRDKLTEFGKRSFESAVRAILKAMPRDVLVAIVQPRQQQEAEEPIEVRGRWELEGLPRDELEAAVQRMLFDPPSREEIDSWLRTSIPGGKSWDERLKAWVEQTRAAFLTQITQGLAAGETPDQIEKRLRPFADGLAYKSERIARTEACRVAERANLAMCDDIGDMIAGQQIFAIMDEWTRPHHAARHGRTYWKKPDGTYRDDQGNLLPELPDEPNCRCMTIPVLNMQDIVAETPTLAAGVYTAMAAIPKTPIGAGYEDWWKTASEKERMTAVGVNRYRTVKKLLGRDPEWFELIDAEGKLLPVEVLERETQEERMKRVEAVKAQILQQELAHLGLTRTGGILPARLPGATGREDALRAIEQRIRGEPIEYGFCVTDDGTLVLAKSGGVSHVSITADEKKRIRGTTWTHNHPGGSSLSRDDVETMLSVQMRGVRAVTESGVYHLEQTGETKHGDDIAKDIGQEYELTFDSLLRPKVEEYFKRETQGESKRALRNWWKDVQRRMREKALEDVAKRHELIFRRETL